MVNSYFWILIGSIIKTRWFAFVSMLGSYISVIIIVNSIAVMCLPFYAGICTLEISMALVYYLIPMVSFMCCVARGFWIGLRRYVQEQCCLKRSRIRLLLRLPCSLIIGTLLFYYLYVFIVLFYDSFFSSSVNSINVHVYSRCSVSARDLRLLHVDTDLSVFCSRRMFSFW